ncbi:MAG: hypothetical protein OIF50_16710 [Flavobacteriaceae bacterium]|nr:hypothetical protein [Flavobacteriaceae bacterium]
MEITKDNYVEEMMNRIPKMDKHTAYYLRLRQHNCIYEILVNDYLVEKNYGMGKLASGIMINKAILKSGTQTLTYRMYPLGDLLGGEKPIDMLLDNSSMSIKLIRVEDMKTYDMSKEEVLLEHRSATKDGKFVGAGLPYYEFTYEFEAKVPYENEGWSQGIRLDTLGDDLMERYVKKWYEDYKDVLKKQNLNKQLNYSFEEELRNAITEYKTKQDLVDLLDEYIRDNNLRDKNFEPTPKSHQMILSLYHVQT